MKKNSNNKKKEIKEKYSMDEIKILNFLKYMKECEENGFIFCTEIECEKCVYQNNHICPGV